VTTVCRWWQHALVNCNGLLPEILESSSRCPSEAESRPPKAKDICYCYSSRSCISNHISIISGNRDKRPMHTSILMDQRSFAGYYQNFKSRVDCASHMPPVAVTILFLSSHPNPEFSLNFRTCPNVLLS
jgi:hypothetical protein